jgi:hypothetical protein
MNIRGGNPQQNQIYFSYQGKQIFLQRGLDGKSLRDPQRRCGGNKQ